MILYKLIGAAEYVGGDFGQTPQFRVELLSNGDAQGIPRAVHQGQLAVEVVQFDICHALGCPSTVVDAVGQGGIVGIGSVQDGQQAVVTTLAGDSLGVGHPFCLGHLLEVSAQLIDGGTKVLHGTIRLDCAVLILPEGRAGEGDALQQPIEGVSQGCSGDAALDAAVGHEAHGHGHVLNAVPQSSGHRRGHLERLAHDGHVGVGVGRCSQNVGEVGRILCRQAKGAEAVGHDVRHHSQVFPGGRRQLEDAVHALEHIVCVPASHGHVAHGVAGLLGGELCGGSQLLGLGGQRGHLLGVGLRKGLHVGHSLLKIPGQAHALQVGVRNLLQRRSDAGGGDGILDRPECLSGLLAKANGTVGGIILGGFQLPDLGGQLGTLLGQVACIHPGGLQPLACGTQFLVLPLQGHLGVLDPLLQLDLFPLQTSCGALSFLDLLLEEVVLFLQALQFGAGGLDCALLFLVGCDVALHPVEALDFLPQPGKFRLSLREGTTEPAVHPGVQGKEHLKFLFTGHWMPPSSPRLQ